VDAVRRSHRRLAITGVNPATVCPPRTFPAPSQYYCSVTLTPCASQVSRLMEQQQMCTREAEDQVRANARRLSEMRTKSRRASHASSMSPRQSIRSMQRVLPREIGGESSSAKRWRSAGDSGNQGNTDSRNAVHVETDTTITQTPHMWQKETAKQRFVCPPTQIHPAFVCVSSLSYKHVLLVEQT
jgi:hypothetical protein